MYILKLSFSVATTVIISSKGFPFTYLFFLHLIAPSDHVPPIIRQGPANHTLAPGSTIQLHCHIMGNPTPSIQWEKDGQRILGNDGRIILMENGTFQISNLQVL